MAKDYVEGRDGGFYVAGTRVTLDSLVYAYLRGESPEGIAESFPAISLEQIFGALAYYAANRQEWIVISTQVAVNSRYSDNSGAEIIRRFIRG